LSILAKYWYLVGGIAGVIVFLFMVWRKYKRANPSRRAQWRSMAVAIGVAGLLSYPLADVLMANSDAFETAERFLQSNAEVLKIVGATPKVSLTWLGGSLQISGDSGNAKFTLDVRGDTDSIRVYTELEKRGTWELKFARLMPNHGATLVIHESSSKR
jgi:hypothetical protein